MAEAFPTSPAVGDKVTAAQGAVIARDAVIVASGRITITPSAANTPTVQSVSFGKTFPSQPLVVVTAVTSVPGTVVTGVAAFNITTTGCDIYLTRTNTTATDLCWVAILNN